MAASAHRSWRLLNRAATHNATISAAATHNANHAAAKMRLKEDELEANK